MNEMYEPNLISDDEALLVLGSMYWNTFAKEDNRYHSRDEIFPVQLVFGGEIHKLGYFQDWGELGVSSLAIVQDQGTVLYITTGADLVELRVAPEVSTRRFDIPHLKDVHQIMLVDKMLWMANTGYNEAVGFDISKGEVTKRIALNVFRSPTSIKEDGEEGEEIDRFHCNQVFRGMDGKLYGLVQHIAGKMLAMRLLSKILVKPGNGGVIELEGGKRHPLWLKTPHTVSIVNNEYWVFSSRARKICVFGSDWKLKQEVETESFGRGADLSHKSGLFYAGQTEWRISREEREKLISEGVMTGGNLIQVFDQSTLECAGKIRIQEGIEQINNVYVLPRDLAEKMLEKFR